MRKWKVFLDFEKEERWLNRMASDGFEFVGRSMGYIFRQAKAEKTNIKMDYRTFKNQTDFIDYCTLFEDCGWKHIAGTKNSGTQYFKQARTDADEDIFSDANSKAGRYKRMSQMYFTLAICYLPILIALMTNGALHSDALLNPKELYYTPGLWEMSGASFWGAFLFETPFAFFRTIPLAFFPIIIVLFIVFFISSLKAERQFKKIM
ncbi:DUF2812 domain-containing protein [Pseudoneobacillus sp. C159]